jgi:mono/diheme cytochrome c family protein
MSAKPVLILSILLLTGTALAATPAVESLLRQYQEQGARTADAAAGEKLWTQTFASARAPMERSCASCHTSDPRNPGKHVTTGKAIKPMAPSVNARRFTDTKKIEKWFKRNCRWTLGRECNAQEKADLLSYLQTL